MNASRKRLSVGLRVLFGVIVASGFVFGQSKTITLTIDAGRPLAQALLEIEKLSGIPINFEDVRYQFPGDLEDVTAAVTNPRHEEVTGREPRQVLMPRGEQLSANFLVDEATGTLPDATSVTHALNALLAAYRSTSLPGDFKLETYNGGFFIEPTQTRDATGATVPVNPVLATQITLPQETRNAGETLKLLLDQVSTEIGSRVDVGTMPINTMAHAQVTIGAQGEPAKHVIARFLASLVGYGSADPASAPGMSYRLFFVTQLNRYILHIYPVPNPNAKVETPPTPVQPPPKSSTPRAFTKAP